MTRAALVFVALAVSSCGASRASERGSAPVDQNVVLGDELRRYGAANLFDALRSLRPGWFRANSPTFSRTATGPIIYLDGRRFGGTSSLGIISIPTVVSVRYYSPSEAHGRFGPGHLQGAIDVTSGPAP